MVYHISIWRLGALFRRDKPTEDPLATRLHQPDHHKPEEASLGIDDDQCFFKVF